VEVRIKSAVHRIVQDKRKPHTSRLESS
jgi:hypothetical protein